MSRYPKDYSYLSGQKFNHLTAVREHSIRPRYWVFRCDCGAAKPIFLHSVLAGKQKTCGHCHLTTSLRQAGNKSHGHSCHGNRSPEYTAWSSMHTRCSNPKCDMYHRYGARGISVCERWSSFEHFLADMGARPSTKHSLERRNTDGPYSPQNCYWATHYEQSRNKTNNRFIEYNGERLVLADWATRLGCKRPTLLHRLNAGWSDEQVVSTPVGKCCPSRGPITYGTITDAAAGWERRISIKRTTILARLDKGWTIGQALGFEPPRERKRRKAT